MNAPRHTRRLRMRAWIAARLAVVLAVIAIGGGLLAYEWEQAHAGKSHSGSAHHYRHSAP